MRLLYVIFVVMAVIVIRRKVCILSPLKMIIFFLFIIIIRCCYQLNHQNTHVPNVQLMMFIANAHDKKPERPTKTLLSNTCLMLMPFKFI